MVRKRPLATRLSLMETEFFVNGQRERKFSATKQVNHRATSESVGR
jgi:hypothetical protein